MATDEASLSSIQTDGLSASLYSYLWAKHDGLGFSCNVPDTLVYRSRCLDAWYFTSAVSAEKGMIKKRGPSYLTNEAIMTFFKDRTADGFDIVAVLITQKEIGNRLDYSAAGSDCALQYLTLPMLEDFLLNKKKPLSGILQKFLLPRGGHNSVLQAVWTPNSALFRLERRTTRMPLYAEPSRMLPAAAPPAHQVQASTSTQAVDTAPVNLLERVCTYDGAPHLSSEEPVRGDALPSAVRSLCEGIASHLFAVTRGQAIVSKMILMLKMAKDGKLYLLYASSIRLDDSGSASKAAMLKAALSLPVPSPLRSLASPPAQELEHGTTPAAGSGKGKTSRRRDMRSASPPGSAHSSSSAHVREGGGLDGGPSRTLSTSSRGAATVASSVHRLQAALRDPAGLQASSSKGPLNLSSSPQAKGTITATVDQISPSRHRHLLIDRLADVAEEENVDAERAAKYLDRRAELYAPADKHDHRIPSVMDGSQCPSCGRAMEQETLSATSTAGKAAGACTVQHMMIVKHYDALCKLLRVEPYVDPGHTLLALSKGGHLPGPEVMAALEAKEHNYWPSAAQTLALSAGVGIFAAFPPGTIDTGLEADEADTDGSPGKHAAASSKFGRSIQGAKTVLAVIKEPCDFYGDTIRLLVPEVPPTLLAVQPMLRAATYRSLRRDPLWMVKTVTVCDACFVGYSTLQEAFMAGTDPMLALLQIANAAGSRTAGRREPEAPPATKAGHRSFIGETKDVESAMAFAASLQTKGSIKGKERDKASRRQAQFDVQANDAGGITQQLAFTTVESTEEAVAVHSAAPTQAKRPDPRAAGVSEALIAAAERLLGTPVADGSPPTELYALPSTVPAHKGKAAKALGGVLSTSHYAEVGQDDAVRGMIKANDPIYSIRAESWHVEDYPQPDPSTGLLAAGLVHYGKRSYLGLIRVAAQWETISIDWNRDAYAKHEARLPGYPQSDSDGDDDGDDAASVHGDGPVVVEEDVQEKSQVAAVTGAVTGVSPEASSARGLKSNPLVDVVRSHRKAARRVHRVIPDEHHFCVYFRSTKSGRTMAMFMRGSELCRSGNPICRAAARRWKQLYMPRQASPTAATGQSPTPDGSAQPVTQHSSAPQEGMTMQGLYGIISPPKAAPAADVETRPETYLKEDEQQPADKAAVSQHHKADYCVLSCTPRPPEQCSVRGELLFALLVHRLGESYSAEIGPVPYEVLVTTCAARGLWYTPLLYAAKARLASSILAAEAVYGSKLLMIQSGHTVDQIMTVSGASWDAYPHLALTTYGSLPLAGTVLRLLPGHFLGGKASLDRYRAWKASKTHEKSSETAAMSMLQGIINPQGISKQEKDARRQAALALESHIRDKAKQGKDKAKAVRVKDLMSPVEVATTLESVMDLPVIQARELEFSHALTPLKVGIVARTMVVMPSAHTLVITLSLEAPGSGGSSAPGHQSAHERAEGLLKGYNAPQFVMKIFSLTNGQLLRMSALDADSAGVLQKPVASSSVCAELEKKTLEDWSDLPANPLLQVSALNCLADVQNIPGEEIIAARIVPGAYAQRFVGSKDVESPYHAARDPWGIHGSVKTGGCYVLSLSVVRCKEEGGQDVSFPPSEGLIGPTIPGCVDLRVTRTEASLRKALLEAKASGKLTRDDLRAARQAVPTDEGPGADLRTLHLPSRGMLFLVRCQYLRHPLPLYETMEDHDEEAVRLAEASGKVVKSGDMLTAEVHHWARHGQLPTAIALVRAVKGVSGADGDASIAAAPRVRACQTAVDPVYSYVLELEHMCRADLNPFIDLLGGLPAAMEAADRK